MTALLIATRNAHKYREIQQLLADGFLFFTLNDFPGAPDPVEDGPTFAANASKKVSALADWLLSPSGMAALPRRPNPPLYIVADDSGLEVDALGGAPGVHSARFAALDTADPRNSPDHANNAKLLRLLDGIPPDRRAARFRCVLALRELRLSEGVSACNPQSAIRNPQLPAETILLEGLCPGRIALQPSGGGGFGYDPLFIPDGFSQSFAELGDAVKNTLSHRARALEKLRQYLSTTAAPSPPAPKT